MITLIKKIERIAPYGSIIPNPESDARYVLGNNHPKIDQLTRALINFDGRSLEKIPEYLAQFKKTPQTNPHKYDNINFSDFGIDIISLEIGYCWDLKKGMFFADVSYQFVLTKNQRFVATMGFEPQENGFLISQIQGFTDKITLGPLKWSRALVSYAVDWSKQFDLSELYILPYTRNQHDCVINCMNKSGESTDSKLIYDVTAKREGFKYDKNKEVFVKKLI